jgi:hypothetical protein
MNMNIYSDADSQQSPPITEKISLTVAQAYLAKKSAQKANI